MITALLLTSLAIAPTEATAVVQQEAPVKVWLSKQGDLKRGDRVRVYARAESDGYLLVLHAEPDGRIRVLLPLDPFDDNFVRGGQDLELLGRGDREAFRVYQSQGLGTVYAAFSRDPFRTDAFIRDDHWDYRLFDTWRLNEDLDPEAELTALVREMAGGARFDYDLTQYWVGERYVSGGGGGYYSSGWNVGVSFGFGWYPYWGFSIGWGYPYYGWGYPYYGWGYPYYGWGYARYGWGYPYYPYYGWGYPGYGWGYYPVYPVHPSYPVYGGGYGGYYNAPGYYTTAYGQQVRGRYTFKDNDRAFGSGGISSRRRSPTSSSRSAFASSATAQLNGRRVSPTAGGASRTATTGRRVSPTATAAASSGRRVSPTASGVTTSGRRVSPSTADVARRSTDGRIGTTGTATSGSRVQPDGWGITDGRRTIAPTRTPTTPNTAIERRQVIDPVTVRQGTTTRRTPDNATTQRSTVTRPSTTPKSGTVERRSTSTSSTTPVRPPSSATSGTTVRRSDPRPSTTRSTPSSPGSTSPVRRSTPSSSRSPSPVQRSTPSRPSTPTMRAPSRPSTPTMRAPSRAPSRPSTPTMRAPARAPSSAPARTPTRSTGRRKD